MTNGLASPAARAIASPRASGAGRARLALWTLPLAVILALMLCISDDLLAALGIAYSLEGGSLLVKIHISTLLLLVAALLLLSRSGNPVSGVIGFAHARPQYFSYMVAVLLLSVYLVLLQGTSGVAFVVDSLLRPAVVALVLVLAGPLVRRQLFPVMVALVCLNAMIGIVEVLTEWRLVPYTRDGIPVVERYFRATALIGHPLLNAIITATALVAAAGYMKGALARSFVILTLCLGLLAFGGRTAFVVGIAMLMMLYIVATVLDLARGRYTGIKAIAVVLIMLVVPAVVASAVVSLGLGDRIVQEFRWDASAQARLQSVDLLTLVSFEDLVFGVSSSRFLQYLDQLYVLNIVENFWIVMLVRFGLIGFVPFVIALAFFLFRLMKDGGLVAKVAVIGFLVIASSNNSLSTKNPALSMLVVLVLTGSAYSGQPSNHPVPRRRTAYGVANHQRGARPVGSRPGSVR